MISSASSTSSTSFTPVYGPARRLVLAPVVVDVAVLALLLGAEVLADPEDGQVDEVAPLDRGGHLHDGLAVGELVPVVLRHRRHADVRDPLPVEVEPEHAVLAGRDAVRRVRVHAHGDDGAAQVVRAAGEDDLLRRPAQCGLAQLGQGAVVEGEDEVRLRLDVAGASLAVSLSADSSKAIPPRSRSSLITASRGTCGNRSIRSSTSAVRLPIPSSSLPVLPAAVLDSSRYAPPPEPGLPGPFLAPGPRLESPP